MCAFKMWLIKFLCVIITIMSVNGKYWKPTIYQKIRQSPKLTQFYSLLESNRPAKLNLQYGEMTVFVPTNEAFEWFSGRNLNDIINYHMAWYAKQLKDLKTGSLTTVMEENPPLWVTKLEDDIYINNARIIPEVSDYASEINDRPRKPQVLHVVDEVLDPVVKRISHAVYNPNAFDFLMRSQFWDIGDQRVELFHRKLITTGKEGLFKAEGNFTFFVPVDEGFTDYRLQMLDNNIIDAHVIPHRVLFTRPSPKDSPFETLANGDFMYIVVLFSQGNGKLFVKSHTLIGDSNHPTGEIITEIVKPNIPVKNGVVHLIKRPLAVFDRVLTVFPKLPVLDKLSMDPTLDRTYTLGEETGFNSVLNTERKKITYFIPRDKAWRNLQAFLELSDSAFNNFVTKYGKSILSRHVIISNTSFTMEEIKKKSNNNDTADVDLPTLGGKLRVGITETDGNYVMYWRNQIVHIYRPNYQCTNGIVHVTDELFVNEEDFSSDSSEETTDVNSLHVLNMLIRVTL